MQVSYIVSNINRVLVQDRILYDLHNTRELMIMQMREKREGSKREVKYDLIWKTVQTQEQPKGADKTSGSVRAHIT